MTGRGDAAGAPGRALVPAVAAVVLGIPAHGEAGGTAPAAGTFAALVGVVALVAAGTGWLAARGPGVLRLATLLGGGQLALHLTLSSAPPGRTGPGEHASHLEPAGHAMAGAAAGGPVTMVAAHLVVTALVTAGMVGADRALTGLSAAPTLVAEAVVAVVAVARRGLASALEPGPRAQTAPPARVGRGSSPTEGPDGAIGTGPLVVRVHPRRGPPTGIATVPARR